MTTRRNVIRPDRTLGTIHVEFPPSPEWMSNPDRGCAPGNVEDPGWFTSENKHELHLAAAHCNLRCPVRAQCDAWAEAHNERFHVWGGKLRSSAAVQQKPVAA